MDMNSLLGGVTCSCGKTHTCDIQYVYIEKGAAKRLRNLCCERRTILLVADENTFAVAGEKTLAELQDKQIKQVIFDGKEVLVPNEEAIAALTEQLENVDMIVGIGSGVIQDLCKYVSFYNGIPYIIVATAPSMDGYASNGAAMITGGMKVTYPAGLPTAIVADVDVLVNAPMDMIKAGYGDIVGKLSALNDWKVSRCINGEYFCDYIYDLTYDQIKQTLDLADGILKRDEESIRILMQALVTVGILMSFAGSSRPASGSEHHLSHFFEITGILQGEEYFPHGIDVAYSTVITSMIREKLLSVPFGDTAYRLSDAAYRRKMQTIYTSVADGCIELQKKVGNYAVNRSDTYKQKEAEIKEILSEVPAAADIEKILALVNLNMDDFYALYSKEKIKNAVLYAKDLKDRYTVLWLYYDLLGDREDV